MSDQTYDAGRASERDADGLLEGLSEPRRRFLTKALGLGAGAAGLAALGDSAFAQTAKPLTGRGGAPRRRPAASGGIVLPTPVVPVTTVTDADILNFALNLEYLEAEYYTYAVSNTSIANQGINVSGAGVQGTTIVKPNATVPFATNTVRDLARELAIDERQHVVDLQTALTSRGFAPVAFPTIDLLNSFNLAGSLAGLGPTFDPFASEFNFLLGAYVFEDVGVTAYHGATQLISDRTILDGAVGIMGTEAYHAGAIRTLLFYADELSGVPSGTLGLAGTTTAAISTVRSNLSGANDDYGVSAGALALGPTGTASVPLINNLAMTFARTFRQVLNIVYLSAGTNGGGFFPNGLNGTIF